MDAIVAEAKKYRLIVIEDCAPSMGTWGDIGYFTRR